MRLGGKDLLFTWEDAAEALLGVRPEQARKGAGNVEMLGTFYPVEQVVSTLTHWSRDSFSELEALNALTELGFTCRRDGRVWELEVEEGAVRRPQRPGFASQESADLGGASDHGDSVGDGHDALLMRIRALEQDLQAANAALLDIANRVTAMEASGSHQDG